MARKTLRTKEEIDALLASGGLELAEEYDPDRSYPKNGWLRTRCRACGTEADYRLGYVMDKTRVGEPVCRACYWRAWMRDYPSYAVCLDSGRSEGDLGALAAEHGYGLVEVLVPGGSAGALVLVECAFCGRRSVVRECDLSFGCSCRSHPNMAAHYAPPVSRKVSTAPTAHERKAAMTMEEARRTPVADVPELLAAWDDERNPETTMVWPTGWHGMYPGSGQYRFKCENGHHPYAFPYTYLMMGCPACRANTTKGTGLYLADTSPELAAEWAQARNGKWAPENVRDNSKRAVWWRCLACGHEWEATPRARSKRDGQLCPSCGKIQGSIAWVYPLIAKEWDPSNPVSPWAVRPTSRLGFTPLWRCSKDPSHSWRAKVTSRVAGGECPECVGSGRSAIELRVFEAVRKTVVGVRSGAKYDNPLFSSPWTVDISLRLSGRMVAIEYDGAYWHAGKVEVDARKSRELVAAGFVVVRIREDGLPALDVPSNAYAEVSAPTARQDAGEIARAALATAESRALAAR